MHRVLIVDDEEPVLDGYEHLLKGIPDFALAGKARSGYEAVRAIRELKPDLVFMDINIPEIDGLGVIAEVHSFHPGTIFILSTAYERFDLARKAIPLGVLDYLVKPVSKKTFLDALDAVRSALRDRAPELAQEGSDLALKQFLSEAIWTELGEDEWNRYRELFALCSDKGIALLVDFEEDPAKWAAELSRRLSFRHRCLHSLRGSRGIFLIPEDVDRAGLMDKVSSIAKTAIPDGAVRAFALGQVCRGPDLYLSCESALAELRRKERDSDQRLRERLRVAQIRRRIGASGLADLRALFTALWEEAFAAYEFPVAQAKMVAFFTLLLEDYAACRDGKADWEADAPFDPAESIMPLKDIHEWSAWATRAFGQLSAAFEARRSGRFPVPLAKAMAFIGERYAERLHLSLAAEAAQVSGAYLSRLFSEHLRTSFIDYLTELRVENAERLMRDTRMTMKEISFAVGYPDPNYFARIFRKSTGLSPTAYAAEHRGLPALEEEES